jgi:uncharacterized protein YraI
VGKPEEKRTLKNLGIDGRIRNCMGGMDWIDVAQGRDRWWAIVTAVMNFGDP